jgi:gamma-glutamyltranspeptidase/glutathione hydrolase
MLSKVFISRNNAVATEHPLSSLAALDALREGGNAVDAAVAAGFALSVTQPQLSGLGGDFFALYYEKEAGKVHCLNSSGYAPRGLTIDLLKSHHHKSMPLFGPYSVVIPGHVRGLHSLHERFGQLQFSSLLSKAIRLAEEGFPIHAGLCRAISSNWKALSKSAREVLAPRGVVPTPGEILKQSALAVTLRRIADRGVDGFYEGETADAISKTLSQENYTVSSNDFREFKPEWCEPLVADYRDARIYEIPPNSMGATTLLILKHLEALNLKRMEPNSKERITSTLKCVKEAYARRDEELGDPRFITFDLQEFLTSKSAKKSSQVRRVDGDTTYFAMVDGHGNILSGIQSLFHNFGSRVFVEDCGFFLNDRASAFRFEGPNKLEPRKRPLHTLSAMLLELDGYVRMGLGASGGEFRPQQHALFITNMVDYSMSLENALGFPRFLWKSGRDVMIEKGLSKISSGYKIELLDYPGKTGVAQGVEVLKDAKKAVCDVRGDGIPLGA